jgi:hypothetical protein
MPQASRQIEISCLKRLTGEPDFFYMISKLIFCSVVFPHSHRHPRRVNLENGGSSMMQVAADARAARAARADREGADPGAEN